MVSARSGSVVVAYRGAMEPIDDDRDPAALAVTWAGLLARWMEVARAAVALPEDDEGERWRRTVAHAITLHAVTLALGDVLRLPRADRALARDRATLLVQQANAAVDEVWRALPLPESVAALRHDASVALDGARWAGAAELLWPGPGTLLVPDLVDPAALDPVGTLCVAAPGTILMPNEPVAWWLGRPDLDAPGCEVRDVLTPRQIYRQLDDDGRAVRDVVAPLDETLPAGMPLLVPLLDEGCPIGRFLRSAQEWERMQRAAMTSDRLPVEWLAAEDRRRDDPDAAGGG